MGGVPALGYDVRDRRLVVKEAEAAIVRLIYDRYLKLGCVRLLKDDLDRREIVSKVRVSSSRAGGAFRGARYTNSCPIRFTSARSATGRNVIRGSTSPSWSATSGRRSKCV
jgi:hypothetical protein